MNIPASYDRKLKNYLLWATMENVGTAGSTRGLCGGESPDGLSPEEVFYRWESLGEKNLLTTDTKRLYRYAAGKGLRDFYISNWTKDVKDGHFVAEEFICEGGMDIEEFHKVFKRYPDPWLMRRIWTTRLSDEFSTRSTPGEISFIARIGWLLTSYWRSWRPKKGRSLCSPQ